MNKIIIGNRRSKSAKYGKVIIFVLTAVIILLLILLVYKIISINQKKELLEINNVISASVSKIVDGCVQSQEPLLDVIPFAKNNVELCSIKNNFTVTQEMCEFNFYLYKSFENSFSDCNALKNERAKKICDTIHAADASECSQLGDDKFICEAIIKNDAGVCNNAPNSSAIDICSNVFYIYEGLSKGDSKQCENIKEIETVKENDKWFNSQKVKCYYITEHNTDAFDSSVLKRCWVDEIAATLEPKACNYVFEIYKQDCANKIAGINNCLTSHDNPADEKTCISGIIDLSILCGGDGTGPSIATVLHDGKQDCKKKEFLQTNPDICRK